MEVGGNLNRKKIVLLTSGQPSLNPRLVKEADALIESGFEVKVIYQFWNQWGTELDEKLLPTKKWKTVRVGGSKKKGTAIYIITRFINSAAKKLSSVLGLKFGMAELAIARSGYLLYWEARKYKADLYIGHNIGALAATIKAARHHGKPAGFDAEDYHRNEVSDDPKNSDVVIKKYLEEKYFPELNYITTASPLIEKAYRIRFPGKNFQTILNVFPRIPIQTLQRQDERESIRLFWFSQTIGQGRGLEEVMEAVACLNHANFELHLLGSIKGEDRIRFHDYMARAGLTEKVFFYDPLPPDNIIAFASGFDIGIASETGAPLNRDICLTNKIFTYLQSGLAILASDTTAQVQFLETYPGTGSIYQKENVSQVAEILLTYYNNRALLYKHRMSGYVYGQSELNWEIEKYKFLDIVTHVLQSNGRVSE